MGSLVGAGWLRWAVVDNQLAGYRCLLELSLENRGAEPLGSSGWALYFNGVNPPEPGTTTAGARVEQVNGDVYRLVPTDAFAPLLPGQRRAIRWVGAGWALQCTDAARGAYLVYDDGTPAARALALGDPSVAPCVRPEQLTRGPDDPQPLHDAARAFHDNEQLAAWPADDVGKLTPTPLGWQSTPGELPLTAETKLVCSAELSAEADLLRASLRAATGLDLCLSTTPVAGAIQLLLDAGLVAAGGREAYELDVTPNGATLRGASAEAVFRGTQSLLQLLPPERWSAPAPCGVPCCRVTDAPRYAYRGLLLDVARNFSSKQTVLRLLELMALYKLNRLHLHLTDDEGWRLSIAALPELTDYGARRGFSLDEAECLPPSFGSGPSPSLPGSGHYSRADFIEILRYAHARHIQIVPELDVPGHARAAIKSMQARCRRLRAAGDHAASDAYLLSDPDDTSTYCSAQGWRDNVICVGRESCYTFIETVVRELKEMFDEAGAPLQVVHMGGDEMPAGCWEQSPQCQAFMAQHELADLQALRDYFYQRLRGILRAQGLRLAGWEEIALLRAEAGADAALPNPKFRATEFLPYVWNNVGPEREDLAARLVDAGYDVVLCHVTHLYLDFAYERAPEEPGYYWAGFTNVRQVLAFSRPEPDPHVLGIQAQLWGENLRSAAELEYLLLPRLLPFAERAWARASSDPNEFMGRLGHRELPRLDGFLGGFGYRVPAPGAQLRAGHLHANSCTPGFTLRYTTDGTDPTLLSRAYGAPVPAAQAKVAAFSAGGRRGRVVTAGG